MSPFSSVHRGGLPTAREVIRGISERESVSEAFSRNRCMIEQWCGDSDLEKLMLRFIWTQRSEKVSAKQTLTKAGGML